jgi:hypothetical protein
VRNPGGERLACLVGQLEPHRLLGPDTPDHAPAMPVFEALGLALQGSPPTWRPDPLRVPLDVTPRLALAPILVMRGRSAIFWERPIE